MALRAEPTSLDDTSVALSAGRILFSSEKLLIINKPADVRMDGPSPVTVEKLMLRHLLSPTSTTTAPQQQQQQRGESPAVTLKWPHQLDYATSVSPCPPAPPPGSGCSTSGSRVPHR